MSTAIARFLEDRLTGVQVRVIPLGNRDMLWSRPDEPWQVDLATTDSAGLLPVFLHGNTALIGPFGGGSPCLLCVARRWQVLRTTVERDVLENKHQFVAPHGSPFRTAFALEAMWRIAERTITQSAPVTYQLQMDDLRVRRYPVIADAHCPRCGEPATAPAAVRLTLSSRRKQSVDDFRLRPVGEYDLEPSAQVNPVCGAVGPAARPRLTSTTTANVRGHIGVRGDGYIYDTYWGGHSDSYARSALLGIMEAHERIAGTRPLRPADVVVDTYRNLASQAVDPAECGLYAEEFYARNSGHYVPYHPDLVLPWVWGFSLRDNRAVLVPAAVSHYHSSDRHNRFVQECSNGCASGGSLEEAVLHGILELVERDAFLIAWYARPRLSEMDPRSCALLHCRLMVDRISMYGYDVRLFDARTAFPIPAVIAVAQRRDGGLGNLLFGAAAGLDPDQAIAASVYEVAAEIPTFAQDTERRRGDLMAKAADFDKVVSLWDHARMFGLPDMARHAAHLLGDAGPPADLPSVEATYRGWRSERPCSLDLLDDVEFCVRTVTRAGFDVIVVDQTTPEQAVFATKTVSVTIPGLLPIDFGWAAQRALHMPRTRTVLREAGLRATDLDPADLNPAPHPFP